MRQESQVPPAQRQYYEELFTVADRDQDGVIGLNDAAFFRKSMLPNEILRDIWQLSDLNNGYLSMDDFFVALKLISLAQMGAPISIDSIKAIPVVPPPKLQDIQPLKFDWIIPSNEKQQYIDLFNKNDEDNDGYITGQQAIPIFSTSGLPSKILSHIWSISDLGGDQKLDCQEFIIATFLIKSVLKGYELPSRLPESLLQSSHCSAGGSVPSPKIPEWLVPPAERIIYEDIFNKNQQNQYVSGQQAKVIFEKSGLSNQDLKLIWDLSDYNQEQILDKHKFVIAMYLISQKKKGKELPATLPAILLESSKASFNLSSPTTNSSNADTGVGKYNINLSEIVGTNISSPPSLPTHQSFTSPSSSQQQQPGSLPTHQSFTSAVSPTQQSNLGGILSPNASSSLPTTAPSSGSITRNDSSASFDKSSFILPPPKAGLTRMNSFTSPQSLVNQSPQSSVIQPSPPSTVSNVNFTTTTAPTSNSASVSSSSSFTSTSTPAPTPASNTNISQLFGNIERVKQELAEKEKQRLESQARLEEEAKLQTEYEAQLELELTTLDQLNSEIEINKNQLAEKKLQTAQIKETIASTRVDVKSAKSQLEQLKALFVEKTEQYDEQHELFNMLQSDLKEKQIELEKYQKEIQLLSISIDSIKQARLDTKSELNNSTKLVNDSKSEIKRLDQELKQLKTSSSSTIVNHNNNISSTPSTTKSDENIFTSTSNNNNNNAGINSEWDFFSNPKSTSLPTSPFDNQPFLPTTTTTTTAPAAAVINNNISSTGSNGSKPSTPVKSTNPLASSSSSVKSTGKPSFSADLFNTPFGQTMTAGSRLSTNTEGEVIEKITQNFSEQFSFDSSFGKDPFGSESSANPFGEESISVSSNKDGLSETLSEAHTLFEKDPLFETNDAFQFSKDPFGQIVFSNTFSTKDSFGSFDSSSFKSNSNNILTNNNSNSNSITSPATATVAVTSTTTTTETQTTTTTTNTDNNNNPVNNDGFDSFDGFSNSDSFGQTIATTNNTKATPFDFNGNDSFGQTTTTTTTNEDFFGSFGKFDNNQFLSNKTNDANTSSSSFPNTFAFDSFGNDNVNVETTDNNNNNEDPDAFKKFESFGSAPSPFDDDFVAQ
ncbi:hypothetical protein CYY_008311 [Polysphondylium violaceum]|uniref:Epidermal growth factor receptor substrate 15 n=1 Tax=Polysphondylium violaceum TaxID=133409 RepID=A0A8J4PN52_9MYCE|nr:hypothetical protein CYY_008311 [Polysphondylium violaceum]